MSAYCDETYNYYEDAIRKEMAGEPAAIQIEYRVDAIIREMDELCSMATNSETIDLVQDQSIGIFQIMTRAQLILSFLQALKPSKLTVVRNDG